MKKYLFPLVAALFFLSCSSDEDTVNVVPMPTPTFLRATIAGTPYEFDDIVVDTETHTSGEVTYVDLYVKATLVGDPTKQLQFKLEKDVPGTDTVYFFYLNFDDEYDSDQSGSDLATNVTSNANRNIKGTFSGVLTNFTSTQNISIANGSFDISY
jgi:hypothetical protein